MRAYVGQTRAAELVRELTRAGIGECTQRGQLPPRRAPWFYDCGAYADFVAKAPAFDYLQWSRDMRAIRLWQDAEGIPRYRFNGGRRLVAPDFQVLPDIVAGGLDSLAFSLDHADEAARAGVPLYLAVQNGMNPDDIAPALPLVAGLFVGGSLDWKLSTGGAWVAWAHANGRRCHIGRVGTPDRVAWAREIGADSIDSSFPLWSAEHLGEFLAALGSTASRFPLLEAD